MFHENMSSNVDQNALDLSGDIHGHADELKQLLKTVGWEKENRPVMVPWSLAAAYILAAHEHPEDDLRQENRSRQEQCCIARPCKAFCQHVLPQTWRGDEQAEPCLG